MYKKHLFSLSQVSLLALSINLLSPLSASACGGFFCNATQPVNQAAERILFSVQDGQTDMHVQIQYQGPPTGFGWILPVAPGVETTVSSEALFVALDRIYGPQFFLDYQYDENCDDPNFRYQDDEFAANDSGFTDVDSDSEPTVQVISREPVGPYDRAILQADNVEVLRDWLNENEYQIPDSIDEKLTPYIEGGAVFVVIKLLADSDVGDLVPLKLSFPGSSPSIPILPTSVSAEPDMGMIVHVLGAYRAIPSNYQHVIINEAVIDWQSRGNNYTDVVSQAADEAEGKAFATDYAGEVGEQIAEVIQPYSDQVLADLAAATTFGDIQSAIPDRTNPDYQRIFTSIFGEQDQNWDQPADGLVLSEALIEQFNPVYEDLNQLFVTSAVMTRLYTTMSASEMDSDPMFDFNPDLESVSNVHNATIYVTCDDEYTPVESIIELSDGRRYPVENVTPISRQNGETVRGEDQVAAVRIERMFSSGQPEVIREIPPEMSTPNGGSLADMNDGQGPSEQLCNLLPIACENNNESTSPALESGEGNTGGSGKSGGCEQGLTQNLPFFFAIAMCLILNLRRRQSL
ncbi:MAG: hypothetical protein CMH49_01255 [Myxococcales bacterium]|nr:hypothetical protein [Myxococcales bacterium]